MIVSFSVSNYRSFSSEESFSLVASQRLGTTHEEHSVPIPDSKEKVLRTAVLYGANGAGKSNLFKAVRYLRSVALETRDRNSVTGREAFRFGELSEEPSSFDLQFIADNKLYRFCMKVDDRRIVEESLAHVLGGREKTLYERITDGGGKVTVDAPGLRSLEKLHALATVGGPQNQSFLATIGATLDTSDIGDELRGILDWFKRGLALVGPGQPLRGLGRRLTEDSELLEFASEFLRSSSTGVDHLEIVQTEISHDEVGRLIRSASNVLEDVSEYEDPVARFLLDDGNELLIDHGESFYQTKMQAAHKDQADKMVPLDLTEESDGTQRLLHLIPALHQLRTGSGVFLIDEIDRSLHPMLVWKFLEFFLKSCPGDQRQIIVTTHESNLLDLDLLRRDEIWFAEKDQAGATRLYSMADFKVRKDHEIRKHYLQGRFGAVPFLGSLDRLLEEKGHAG